MSTIAVRTVADLPETERQFLERILGRSLLSAERIHFIVEKFSPRDTTRAARSGSPRS